MALSDHEQQLLDQLEQQLRSEDPRFAHNISEEPSVGPGGTYSASRVVVGILGIVAGIGVALGGIWAGLWPLGIVGFAVMVGGGFWALRTDKKEAGGTSGAGSASGKGSGGPGAGPRPSASGGSQTGGGFMDRMEDRWDRRRRGE